MKKQVRTIMAVLFAVIITMGSVMPVTAAEKIVTTATGYTSASDVEYKYSGKYISNWGARGEDCTFLSPNAQKYYVNSYTYNVLSANQGGSSQSNAPSSALYKALQSMMKAEHSYQIDYQSTRYLYKYTDCLLNDTAHISSFYSGKELSGTWDSGATWNREHTWPNSKGLNGNDENDIMMLRPTWVSENSSRGNAAYGEGSGYYDPGESVRGDCARIVLYVYVRWGNTSKMWGTSGVIQNMDTLLRWMEEDPVDTWEMGRNDAVESITGVRNVFVDYPEYAWLLFGKEIPDDVTTPSGIAKSGTGNNSGNTGNNSGNTGNNSGNTGNNSSNTGNNNTGSGSTNNSSCTHTSTKIVNQKEATCTQDGYTGDTYCTNCKTKVKSGSAIKAKGHGNSELQGVKDVTCTEDGYDGDMVCMDCGDMLQEGQAITSPGHHTFEEWVVVKEATNTEDGIKERICTVCDHKDTEIIPAANKENASGSGSEDGEIGDTETTGSGDGSSDKKKANSWISGTAIVILSGCAVGAAIVVPTGCVVGVVATILIKRRKRR